MILLYGCGCLTLVYEFTVFLLCSKDIITEIIVKIVLSIPCRFLSLHILIGSFQQTQNNYKIIRLKTTALRRILRLTEI